MRKPAIALSLPFALSLACTPGPRPDDDAGPDNGEQCALDQPRRDLLALRVQTLLTDAAKVAEHADDLETAWSVSLAGSEFRDEAYAFLVAPCTEPTEYVPYCEEEGGGVSPGGGGGGSLAPGVARCSRLACEDDGIYLAHVWYPDAARTAEDDEHAIEYETQVPPGTATHEPRPFITWRAVMVGELDADVSAVVDASVTIAPADGSAVIDASHSGSASGTRRVVDDHADVVPTISLVFPSLSSRGAISVDATVDLAGDVSGDITLDGASIGTIEGAFDLEQELPVTWADCD